MSTKMNEAKRHHFIPQFILKNFADKDGYVNYVDKKTGKLDYLSTKDIFVVENLYRDDKNNQEFPIEIENDLSVLECKASLIISKFLNGDEVTITKNEEQLLLIFLFVMSFRSKRIRDTFVKHIPEYEKQLYSQFQKDGDMDSWWKRNLAQIVKCKNFEEIQNNKEIDDFVKFYAWQDTIGYEGSFFMIYKIKGKDKFKLSEVYPLCDTYELGAGFKYKNFYMAISKDRILVLVKNYLGQFEQSALFPGKQFVIKPIDNGDSYTYKVGKQFKKFVDEYNRAIVDESQIGYIFIE